MMSMTRKARFSTKGQEHDLHDICFYHTIQFSEKNKQRSHKLTIRDTSTSQHNDSFHPHRHLLATLDNSDIT